MSNAPDTSLPSGSVDRVGWHELEDVAPALFNVWLGHPEVAWARQAWKALRRANLTSYRDHLEKQRVLIRLMVLAVIYLEFCEQAWDERRDPSVEDWVAGLGLSPFRMGQIVGGDYVADWDIDDDEMLRHAAEMLIMEERPKVIRALVGYYGDRQELFVSADERSAGKRPGPVARGRILNNPSGEGLRAFGWVTSGMEPRWHPSEEW